MLWRQGDVFIESIALIPAGAAQQPHLVLADGELTGHSHRVADPDTALLFELRGQSYLQVIAERATVIHQEHGPVTLARGNYRVWRQREYDPAPPTTRDTVTARLGAWERTSRWVID
jgi:hypothetical protein